MKVLMISRANLFTVPGGDTVQISETARALKALGVDADIHLSDETIDYSQYQLIHFFNVIRPDAILPHIKKSELPFVLSPIFVDYSEVERKFKSFPMRLASNIFGPDGMEFLKNIARSVLKQQPPLPIDYLINGHKRSVENCLQASRVLLPNSNNEYNRLQKRYRFDTPYIKVPNAVGSEFMDDLLPAVERSGVLCIGRIEVIKNQLNLIKALNGTDIPLKIIGKPAPNHQQYHLKCMKVAGNNVQFLGQLDKTNIIGELAKAKVHVLPSFFETTGLSSLEAAAMGCNVVITTRGDATEYFGDAAIYCEPDQPETIKSAVEKALHSPVNPDLRQMVMKNYRWDIAAQKTASAYYLALKPNAVE